jgi:hypothetical protein
LSARIGSRVALDAEPHAVRGDPEYDFLALVERGARGQVGDHYVVRVFVAV